MILTSRIKNWFKDTTETLPAEPTIANFRAESPFMIRNALRHFIAGSGIEVGALQNPLDLSGLPVTSVRYVDRETEDDLRQRYPELGDFRLAHVDVVDDGEKLSKFDDGSLDFIIGNHFIEQCASYPLNGNAPVKDFGSGRVRWGDYSATVVDPQDDVTFWSIQEFAATNTVSTGNEGRWGTWWARLSYGGTGTDSRLINISTRGPVQTGDNQMIGGFIM